MSIHNIKTEKKDIFFFSFKGDSKVSTLDQLTLPPAMGLNSQMFHQFGEWLKREGHDWESLCEEKLCRLGIDYFNASLSTGDRPRRFDRMPKKGEM